MMRPVLGTIASRTVVMAVNLLVMMAAGHALGTAGLGTIGLIVLGITLAVLLNNVVGGGALVYLVPRHPAGRMLPAAYAWALLTAAVAWWAFLRFPLVPREHAPDVAVLTLMQSIYTVHFGFLLGRERIRTYNLIVVVQALAMLIVFLALLAMGGRPSVRMYVHASYASFGLSVVLSAIAVARLPQVEVQPAGNLWRELFRQGGLVQASNLLQLLNYRLAYWLIEAFRGRSSLGLYSVATQLSESAWLVPKSLGTVLYSRVSNTEEVSRQAELTLTVAKAAMAFSAAVVMVLVLVPDPVFGLLFGREVTGITTLVLLLAPGIVAMALSQALSHYFSGTGRNVHNVAGSGIGLVVTTTAGLLLVPAHGLEGAAIAASLAYGANAAYQLVVFLKGTGMPLHKLRFTRADAARLQGIRRSWRG
jgi:hypothetical protein